MKVSLVLFYHLYLITANALEPKDVVIVVSTQPNDYHMSLAEDLKSDIYNQAGNLNQDNPVVHFSHIDFPHIGGWAILPLIPNLSVRHKSNCSWFFFAEDRTRIKLNKLIDTLERYDHKKEIWLGHSITDKEPTIIHHFAFSENSKAFKYPNPTSGYAISNTLMQRLENQWKKLDKSASDFSIDFAYELALFIKDKSNGPVLQHEPAFCITEELSCATFSLPFKGCGKLVARESIYFAVKTCQKFHKERISVVQHTWGQQASVISYFSDVQDDSIPTISLGIPNTDKGHCGKTLAIINSVAKNMSKGTNIKWLVLADDDTILSVPRLQELLSCYDVEFPVALGERYGYNIYNKQGYNYITGGGGIVLNRALVRKLIESETCNCPSISSPDDMFLGVCIARLGIDITHSSLFHQARPMDYPAEYLKDQPAVSFHKHWMIDPLSVYDKWFGKDDANIISTKHTEL